MKPACNNKSLWFGLLICSFVRSFVLSFVYSLVCLFLRSFVLSFLCSFVRQFVVCFFAQKNFIPSANIKPACNNKSLFKGDMSIATVNLYC